MTDRISIAAALLEKEDDDAITCKTCIAPADDEWQPYCRHCGIYWKDCDEGLWWDHD